MTTRQAAHWVGIGAAALAAWAPGRASAQASDPAAAQALFDEALALMKAEKFAEACPKLETSQKLDAGMGTEFRLAECYERLGKLSRAWAHFVNVADAAKAARQADREKGARARAHALEPRLPKMTIVVPPAVGSLPGFEVQRDGVPVDKALWGLATPVDPGAHTVTARATGKKPWQQDVQAQEKARVELTLPPLEDEAKAPPAAGGPVAKPPEAAPAGPLVSLQRVGAVGVGAVGIAGIVVGAVFGAKAKSQWKDTLAHCKGGDPTWCYPAAFDLRHDAVTSATVSTIGFVVGGAAVVGGVVLWFTAPAGKPAARAGLRIVPILGPTEAGGAVEARF
jgi:hypothetical protein